MIGRYLTPETITLGLLGIAVGSAAGGVWWAVGRVRWGGLPFVLAFLVAGGVAGRSDWPQWDTSAAVGLLLTLMACVGSHLLLADYRIGWGWIAAGAWVSAVGVWAAVPETGPPILAGACLTGLATTAAFTRSSLAPAAGAGMAAIVGWAALSGAGGRPWAAIGGVLCTGVAPWFVLRPLLPLPVRSWRPGPWLLCGHAVLAVLAARWIAVNPHAGWSRVTTIAIVGLAVAVVPRRGRA